MTVLPAIERELRAQARLPFTYGLRVLGAAAVLAVGLLFAMRSGLVPNDGGRLFGWLNFTLFVSIWVLVPLVAADCISRERREGTIGLLFLTPLRARDIVVAKGFVHGLRALSLWPAVIPMLSVPFLMGGLGRRELALSILCNFSSLCLALAAGLLASTLSKNWLRAQTLAWLLAFGMACVYIGLTGFLFEASAAFKSSAFTYTGALRLTGAALFAPGLTGPGFNYGATSFQYLTINRDTLPLVGLFSVSDFQGCWSPMFGILSAAGRSSWLATIAWLAALSLFFLFLVIQLASWRLRSVWQEPPPSPAQLWLEEVLCAPFIGASFLRWWMRRKLDINPIGWLEQRSWSGRIVMWGWLAVMVSLYSTLLTGRASFYVIYSLQNFMAWLLLTGLAASAAGSFQRERESGVMELLLVSPISEAKIIWGRVRGLWGQFLPAMVLLLATWFYLNRWLPERFNRFAWLQFFCVGFLTLPVIGLYHSLRRKSFISAFLMTLFTGLCVPLALAVLLGMLLNPGFVSSGLYIKYMAYPGPLARTRLLLTPGWYPNLIQFILAAVYAFRLSRTLRDRNFAFTRFTT
jgi:ABC-type transport system involved in multi-copper enzyme maturation permease subunit